MSVVTSFREQRGKAVGSIIGMLSSDHYEPGDLAQLRRLDPETPNRPAFWRLLIDKVPEDQRRGAAAENRWAMLIAAMAQMAPQHHEDKSHPAEALVAEKFSEQRFEQFLRADAAHFWPLLRRLCHFLASRGKKVDWFVFADLILAVGDEAEQQTRRNFARAFYSAQHRAKTASETTP